MTDHKQRPDNFDSADFNNETEGDIQEPHSELDQTSEGETRDEEMDRLRVTAAEADKRVLMAQAEAENFRKRMRRDFEDQLKFAAVPLVIDILQVRDNLLRALEAAGTGSDSAGLSEGVAMVVKQLDDTLAKYEVREIPAAGELFDPNFHEAISQMPSEDVESGLVAVVAQTGFQMHDRVIRPAQVVVSTGK
jgi:molecular chaperone GrpE